MSNSQQSECDKHKGISMLVKMEVDQDGDTWCARGLGEDIFPQAETADELFRNIREAAAVHFENGKEIPER
jgi:hypothetical protein